MKVIESSSAELLLMEKPLHQIAIGVAILGVGFLLYAFTAFGRIDTGFSLMPIAIVVLGIGWTCFMPRHASVHLDTDAGAVRFHSRDIWGHHSREFPLSTFKGAHLIVRRTHGGARPSRRTLARPVLVFEETGGEKHLPLFRLFSSPQKGLKLVNEINRWRSLSLGTSNPMNTSIERWGNKPVSEAITM